MKTIVGGGGGFIFKLKTKQMEPSNTLYSKMLY